MVNKRERLILVLSISFLIAGCASLTGKGPVYGCWCGEGAPHKGDNPSPTNAWDRACREHDRCYDRKGQDNPSCDLRFVKKLERLYRSKGYIPGQMQVAHSYFSSRLSGQFFVQGWLTPDDIDELDKAGEFCE